MGARSRHVPHEARTLSPLQVVVSAPEPVNDHVGFEADAQLVERAWGWLAVPLLASGVGLWLLATGSVLGIVMQIVVVMGAGVMLVRQPRTRRAVRLRVDDAGVHADGQTLCPLDAVVGLAVVSTPNGRLVTLVARGRRPIELMLHGAHVDELRAAVDLALARPATATYRVHAALGCLGLFLGLPLVTLTATAIIANLPEKQIVFGTGLLLPLVFVGVPLLLAKLRATTVTIGEEGIALERFSLLARRRLLRYDAIKSIRAAATLVHIEPREGWTVSVELPTSDDAALFIERVQDRQVNRQDALADANIAATLARGTRGKEEWLEAVRAQSTGSGDAYRRVAIDDDRLFAVLEDPGAPPDARIAAGLALRTRAGDVKVRVAEVARRVRVAASATALPDLRDALAVVADEDDAAEVPRRLVRALR